MLRFVLTGTTKMVLRMPMIEFRSGDILKDESEALVNTVNCVGIMGRGIALQFKDAYPDNFKSYAAACKVGEVKPGRMLVFETGRLSPPRYIINFPTRSEEHTSELQS